MKTIQLEAKKGVYNYDQIGRGETTVGDILRAGGVKRIRAGWYTVTYNGVSLDRSTVCHATFNPKGEIIS